MAIRHHLLLSGAAKCYLDRTKQPHAYLPAAPRRAVPSPLQLVSPGSWECFPPRLKLINDLPLPLFTEEGGASGEGETRETIQTINR